MNYPTAAAGYQKPNLFRPRGWSIDSRPPKAGNKSVIVIFLAWEFGYGYNYAEV